MKNLNNIPDFDFLLVSMLGFWGAIVNFIKREKESLTWTKKIGLFISDIIVSGGIAIVTYLVVMGYEDNALIASGLAGVFAHQGTRAFYIIEKIIEQKFNVKL